MKKNKVEVSKYIRFCIEQLSASNGQMAFEHICRHFSRARIHINILPATGPVQSGGDQARDFETFHSYMSKCSIAQTSFVGLFSDNPVVFACSMQKNPTSKNGKIDSDVNTILASGTKIERIYFFSGQDIPVAKRHEVQNRIRNNKSVELEIIDASALSEHLADPDLFWIATKYLDVSNEYYPTVETDILYSELKREYENRELYCTYEEFSDIKSALRRIYKDEDLKVDLPFWLNKIEFFITNNALRELVRKAIYEKFVAKLIGQNDIEGMEGQIRNYYSDCTEYRNPAKLEDAIVLLSFVYASKKLSEHSIEEYEISSWIRTLGDVLIDEFNLTNNAEKKCWLSYLRALHTFYFEIREQEDPNILFEKLIDELNKILPYIEVAQFYPFDDLSKFLFGIQKWFLELQIEDKVIMKFEKFAEKIDNEIGRRSNSSAAGDKLKQRAIEYFEAEKYFMALDCFHNLKLKWLDTDSPKGIILCTLFIADCYKNLGILYASKYYSMVAAHIAYKSEDVDLQIYVPQALSRTADVCYAMGDWINYFDIMDCAILTHSVITKDFVLYSEDKQNIEIVFHPMMVKYVAERFNLPVKHLVDFRISKWHWAYISDEIDEVLKICKEKYDKISDDTFLSRIAEQISGKPFRDLGERRAINFEIYGIDWEIEFENDYSTNALAEQFATILQIFLVELSQNDLFLLKSIVEIKFVRDENLIKPIYESVSDNEKTIWKVSFPSLKPIHTDKLESTHFFYVAVIFGILNEISLMSQERLNKIVKDKLENENFANKTLFGMPYETLFKGFIDKKSFEISQRNHFEINTIFKSVQFDLPLEFQWKSELVPHYDKSLFEQYIRNRNNFNPLEITMSRVKSSQIFISIVKELRLKGWLDWQINMAVGNVILNYKTQILNPKNLPDVAYEIIMKFQKLKEKECFIPIPDSVVTIEKIEENLKTMQPVSVLKSFGLEMRSTVPNFNAILDFLTIRLNYMEDGKDIAVFDF